MEIGPICVEFYNSRIFRPMVSLKKDAPLVWDGAFKSIQDVDYAISQAEGQSFLREFNALRVELFGLAWVHQLREEEYLVREIIFTRKYLEDMGRHEIWDTMADYNQAIMASAEQLGDRSEERAGVMTRLVNTGLDQEAATRIVNRLGTDQSWEQRFTIAMLVDTFQSRLGVTLQSQGRDALAQIVEHLYEDALKRIKSVRVLNTW